jgi:hypothetical protein
MKELVLSVIENFKERIRNPLLGSFAITFLIYNWRPIFILLLSERPVEERVSFLEDNYISYETLYIPLIVSVVYVLLVPYLSSLIEYATDAAVIARRSRVYRARKDILSYKKNEAIIEWEISDAKAGSKELENLNFRISELTKTIEDNEAFSRVLSTDKESLRSQIEIFNLELNEERKALKDKDQYISELQQAIEILSNNSDEDIVLEFIATKLTTNELEIIEDIAFNKISHINENSFQRSTTALLIQIGLFYRANNEKLLFINAEKSHLANKLLNIKPKLKFK